MKTCSKCKAVKPLTEFGKSKASKDGLSYYCKVCADVSRKEYLDKKREIAAVYRKEKIEKERERRERITVYRKNSVERRRERLAKYYKATEERRREYRVKYYGESIKNLKDNYVLALITTGTKLKRIDIPQDLIELKRAQLKLHRELRK